MIYTGVTNQCAGSNRPVGAGSRCVSCGRSFGYPHPANLTVGRVAPVHTPALSADEADVLRVENGTYDEPLNTYAPEIPHTLYSVVSATDYSDGLTGVIVTPFHIVFHAYAEAEEFIMSCYEENPVHGRYVRTYTILEYVLPPF